VPQVDVLAPRPEQRAAVRSWRSWRLPSLLALALPVVLALVSMAYLMRVADGHGDFDLLVYRGAVRSWVGGTPLYDFLQPGTPYGFTYPPLAALLMLPLSVLPLWFAHDVNMVVDGAIITLTTWWLVRQVAPRHGWSTGYVTACAVPLVCLLEPVRDTVGFGQVNLMLVGLVVLDLEVLRRHSQWAGLGVGLAAAVKLTPAILVVLLLAKRPRAALNAAVVGALATLAAFVAAPGTSVRFWTSALLDTSRVGRTDYASNQALSGALARLADATTAPYLPWLALVLLVGAFGLYRGVRAVRAGDDLAGLALIGLTGALISPISWTHHLWWVVPAIAVLVRAGADRQRWLWLAGAVALLFSSSVPDLTSTHLHQHLAHGPFVVVGGSSYTLAMLLMVAVLPITSVRARPKARVSAGG